MFENTSQIMCQNISQNMHWTTRPNTYLASQSGNRPKWVFIIRVSQLHPPRIWGISKLDPISIQHSLVFHGETNGIGVPHFRNPCVISFWATYPIVQLYTCIFICRSYPWLLGYTSHYTQYCICPLYYDHCYYYYHHYYHYYYYCYYCFYYYYYYYYYYLYIYISTIIYIYIYIHAHIHPLYHSSHTFPFS